MVISSPRSSRHLTSIVATVLTTGQGEEEKKENGTEVAGAQVKKKKEKLFRIPSVV